MVEEEPPPSGEESLSTVKLSSPTLEILEPIQHTYDYFNIEFFNEELPPVTLNFSAKGKSWGYFTPKRWSNQRKQVTSHEISLNPELLQRGDTLILEVLLRQMVCVWQHEKGAPSRLGYVNTEYAEKLESLGLIPSDTGESGGKKTGFRLRHYIDPHGKFVRVLATLPPELFSWKANALTVSVKSQPTRIKYTCPVCNANAWGGQELKLKCFTDNCNAEMQPEQEQFS